MGRATVRFRIYPDRQACLTHGAAYSLEHPRGQHLRVAGQRLGNVGRHVAFCRARWPNPVPGGAFGPEAGLLTIAASIAGSLMIVLWVHARSGRVSLRSSLAEPPNTVKNQ